VTRDARVHITIPQWALNIIAGIALAWVVSVSGALVALMVKVGRIEAVLSPSPEARPR
jgi:ABC-type spermidine/putrescine transport system permease subunit II